jgi:hypothetical protein
MICHSIDYIGRKLSSDIIFYEYTSHIIIIHSKPKMRKSDGRHDKTP